MGRTKVELGKRYRDTISGFEGMVTARHEFLNGCVRYTLVGRAKAPNEAPPDYVVDEQDLESADGEIEPTARRGGARGVPGPTGQG